MHKILHGAFYVHIVIAIVILGGLVFGIDAIKNHIQHTTGVYCTSDGTLSDTMPIQSHRSYCLKTDSSDKTYAVNSSNEYAFSIIDDEGNTLKDFAITHTKPMHVIVVRKDLAYFQHVHPEYDQTTGIFTLRDLTFPTDGQYRIFADFAPEGGMMSPDAVPLSVTLAEDVQVGSSSPVQSIGDETRSKNFKGNTVSLSLEPLTVMSGQEAMLTFTITRDGKMVTDLQEYLGAMGHSILLREDTLDFIHAHPMDETVQNGTVRFMVNVPQSGTYKVFTQFQRSNEVFVTDFVVSVAEGSGFAPEIDHSIH